VGETGTGQVAVAGVSLERFQKIPLTARLTDEQVKALLPHVETISLPEGEILFEQGDPAVFIYYVEQGMVAEVERVPIQPSPQVVQYAPGVRFTTQEAEPSPDQLSSQGDQRADSSPDQLPSQEGQRVEPSPDQPSSQEGQRVEPGPAQPSSQDASAVLRDGQATQLGPGQLPAQYVPAGQPVTKEVVLRYAGQGEFLGRYALVTGQPFRVSAVAEMDSVLLAIPLRYMQPFLFAHEDWRSWFFRSDVATRLRSVPLFMGLDDWDIYRLADAAEVTSHAAGEPIFEVGDESTCLYVVDRGQVIEPLPPPDAPREEWPRYFGPGNFFGHSSLRRGLKRQTTAVARLPTRLFCISAQTIENLLADRADEVLETQARVDLPERLREIPQFSNLTKEYLHLLSGYVCLEYHRPGDIVARQGEPATSLMILVEGEAVVRLQFGKGQPRTVTYFKAHLKGHRAGTSEGNFFGAHALFEEELRGATVEVTRPSVWLVLHRDDFGYFMRETGLSKADLMRGPAPDLPLPFKARRHWLVPVTQILPLTLLMYLILQLMASGTLGGGLRALGVVLLIGIAAAILYFAVDWLDDSLEVTTQAVIHTERKLIFSLERVEVPLQQIQNVSTSVNPVGRWFGAGNLVIESAGPTGQIVFTMIASPDSVRELILKAAASGEAQVGAPAPSPVGDLPLPYKVRRHWVVPLTQVTPLVGILFVIVVLMGAGVLGSMLLPVGVSLLVVVGAVALYRFADWLNDTYEITTGAVVHTEKKPFFSQQRYEIPLQQIQNVNIRVGVIGRYLDYGNVDIDTAAQRGQIAFTLIPHPANVQKLIQNASAQARSGLTVQRQESIRQQIEDQLYPERLKPSAPGSVLIPPEPPPEERRRNLDWLRGAFRGWFPRFELRENGQVIWRKHWINLLQRTGLQFILLLVGIYLVLSFALASLTLTLGVSAIMLPPVTWIGFHGWLFLIVLVLSILAALWFIYQYVDWRNDIYIVTDDEVIDVERELAIFPFFFLYTENRRQASLAMVQYVDLKIPNPLAMILNYGNVIVLTAGAEGTLDFMWVSRPRNVHAEILRRLAAFEERNREREFQERWGDMPRWFETYRDVLDQTGTREA
jgi:CRP-like cAMP-binding protein/membrane protein YdbS with pleckstrin-like domain